MKGGGRVGGLERESEEIREDEEDPFILQMWLARPAGRSVGWPPVNMSDGNIAAPNVPLEEMCNSYSHRTSRC
jgi:hypothetical protein